MKWKKNIIRFLFLLLLVSHLTIEAKPQGMFLEPAAGYNPGRLKTVLATEIGSGILISTGLYYLWYRKHPRSSFHFFNDNAEWLQMDKMGHATTAYTIGAVQYDLMRWCGVHNDASIAIGSLTAIGYMSIVEILDGFSSKWGFSKGDMLANLIGTAIFAGQQKGWGAQRISLRFSYHASLFPQYYPQELGSNWISRILKDYNGQTYWLSFNITGFLPAASHFPAWLNLNLGYGADGMIGARDNPEMINGKAIPGYKRFRQFYLSPDIDLTRVSSANRPFLTAAYLTRFLKFPAPAIEWNTDQGWKFSPFYY